MQEYPDKTILNSEMDTSLYGFYASLAAGGFLLAYAIYYVTVVSVSSDYAYLTLGIITGMIALSCAILHEWFRKTKGKERDENPIEEYSSATAVLMGSLSAIWLSRFLVFYMGRENNWITVQDDPIWMPVWLALLQTVSLILVMEFSIAMIIRHSLGTLPRTVVILAPVSLAFSAISIWLDYSNNNLDIFLTLSFILLMASSIVASLRLNRSILYLLSCGLAVILPLFLGINDIGHMSLLVPFVIIIGITATDRSLSQQMIERGSGVVVAGILFAQIIAASNETAYVFTGLIDSPEPFGLTFWLWMSLLIGWFAPTAMLRTPAMPIALPLSLILLSSEAALIGWFVGIIAFIYLETREQARDWVVRSTYAATVIAWWITIVIGSENEMDFFSIGNYSLDATTGSMFILFPIILAMGFWGQSRGRFGNYVPSVVILVASFNPITPTNTIFLLLIFTSAMIQFYQFSKSRDKKFQSLTDKNAYAIFLLLPIIIVSLITIPVFEIYDIRPFSLIIALIILSIINIYRKPTENLVLRPEFASVMILLFIFIAESISQNTNNSDRIILLVLLGVAASSTLLAVEAGALRKSTPLERLFGIAYLLPIAALSSIIMLLEDANILSLVLHDLLILSAPLIVNLRLKRIYDLSQGARNFGTLTLLALLFIGLTDISGGLLAIPIFSLAIYRATKHVSTPILLLSPFFAITYSTIFGNNYSDNSILWHTLGNIPYLGEFSNLLIFDTPRWVSLLLLSIPLMVLFNISEEKQRPEGSRYGPEQFFGPLIATLLGLSFLLPDEKLAPIFIVSLLTYGSWKYGLLHWFWITPIATYWAILNLVEMIDPSKSSYPVEYATFTAGIVGLTQYLLIKNRMLYANAKESFSFDELRYLAPTSRIMAYCFLLVPDGISDFLPFLTSLLITFDTFKNNRPWLFHCSILLQTFTLTLALNGVDFGYISLLPVSYGLYMIYCSWAEYNPFPETKFGENDMKDENVEFLYNFDYQYNLGLIGSLFTILFIMPFSDLQQAPNYLFEVVLILISAHHMILGFKRDQGWRRIFGLIGLPSGIISFGAQFEGLVLVLALFLAALTLIGQAVLYSSRGGLGIGSTIEGEGPILSKVGLPSKIDNNASIDPPSETHSTSSVNDDSNTVKQEVKQVVEEIKQPDVISDSLFYSDKSNFNIKLDKILIEKMESNIEDAYKSFDPSLWSPILRINSNGQLLLEWERI
jgi:hypothetical protein